MKIITEILLGYGVSILGAPAAPPNPHSVAPPQVFNSSPASQGGNGIPQGAKLHKRLGESKLMKFNVTPVSWAVVYDTDDSVSL